GERPERRLGRLSDRGGDDLGAGAGQLRRHLDRRKIDLRQWGHRKERVGRCTDQQDPGHQQRGRNRPRDKAARNAHLVSFARRGATAGGQPLAAALFTATRAPGCRRYCPAVTTLSPAAIPSSTMATPSLIWPTLRERVSTVLSGLTT